MKISQHNTLVGMLMVLLAGLLARSNGLPVFAEDPGQVFMQGMDSIELNSLQDEAFGPFGGCMQIMPGDSNAPEPPGPGGSNVDAIIDLHQEMGFQWDRTGVAWGSIEYPKGTYRWDLVDQRLEKIMQAGIRSSMIVYGGNNFDGTIYWDGHMPGYDGLKGTQDEYIAFVKLVVERYDGDGVADAPFIDSDHNVRYFEGWNEPVQFAHVTVTQATQLHQRYYAAVKEACAECIVISPGFAFMDRLEEFMGLDQAKSFDMISVHSNYFNDEDPDESMWLNIQWQDDVLGGWGLGDRPWWISEFGPNSSSGHDHAYRSAKMYIVAYHSMFHTNLVSATEWPKEGRGNQIIDWSTWTLKPTGQATKTLISIFQDPQIQQSERITGPDYRVYQFMRQDGLKKFAAWALEGQENPRITLSVNQPMVRITDLYGEAVEEREVTNGRVSMTLSQDPIYVEEISGSGPPLDENQIDLDSFRDKLKGGWYGQMVGVSWGLPTEFVYQGEIIPESEVPNWASWRFNVVYNEDDIYVEVPFMEAMRDHGVTASWDIYGDYFKNTEFELWHANEQGRENLRNGIPVPDSGHYDNTCHADDIDWQIESDFIGQIAPGQVVAATDIAWRAGHVMNYGDGVYGGVFISAMHSAAYFADSVDEIIQAGRQAVPVGSEYRQVIEDVIAWHAQNPDDWTWTWQKIQDKWGEDDRCCTEGINHPFNIDAKLNGAYVLLGLLYGEGDFEQSMLIAMRSGQDSDCNPSSVGGILGNWMGYSKIPDTFKSGLDYYKPFAYTDYNFIDLLDVSEELARELLLTNGGMIDWVDAAEIWTIPQHGTNSPPILEQWPETPNLKPQLTCSLDRVEGRTVYLKASASDQDGIMGYQWFFGDLSYSDGDQVAHTYREDGTYDVICYVTDEMGNTNYQELRVTTGSGPTASFEDVPSSHPYYPYIQELYDQGYIAGCSLDPLLYCPSRILSRAEQSVFVVRGVHGAEYQPPWPGERAFNDVGPEHWAYEWIDQLYDDDFTDGCKADPLEYCPDRPNNRAEGCVFFLRMMYGAAYEPPPAMGIFVDIDYENAWYGRWVDAAWEAGIAEACSTEPELRFCPEEGLSREVAAYMMFQAKVMTLP